MVEARWPDAVETAAIVCLTQSGFADGAIEFIRFSDERRLRAALTDARPRRRHCTFGAQLVVEIDAPRFGEMCSQRHGTLVADRR